MEHLIEETNKLSKKTIELSPSRYKKNFFGKYNKKGEKCQPVGPTTISKTKVIKAMIAQN